MGIRGAANTTRLPLPVTEGDLAAADLIVALKQTEHQPMLEERFPGWVSKVEFWEVDDDPKVLGLIEREVMDLIARLISGGRRVGSPLKNGTGSEQHLAKPERNGGCEVLVPIFQHAVGSPVQPEKPIALPLGEKKQAKANGHVVRVGRETKGRRGKGVTTVSDVPLAEAGLQELASALKQTCGTGGTVKDGRIEIQGDQRERIIATLESMGYRAKRVGG